MFVANHLPFKQMCELQSNKFEHLWVDVIVERKKFSLNAMYRPPNETIADHEMFIGAATQHLGMFIWATSTLGTFSARNSP